MNEAMNYGMIQHRKIKFIYEQKKIVHVIMLEDVEQVLRCRRLQICAYSLGKKQHI
jgi:hypothetical protein